MLPQHPVHVRRITLVMCWAPRGFNRPRLSHAAAFSGPHAFRGCGKWWGRRRMARLKVPAPGNQAKRTGCIGYCWVTWET